MYYIQQKGLSQWWSEREAIGMLTRDYGWTVVSAEAVLKAMRVSMRGYRAS
jgi:hypothetical protein